MSSLPGSGSGVPVSAAPLLAEALGAGRLLLAAFSAGRLDVPAAPAPVIPGEGTPSEGAPREGAPRLSPDIGAVTGRGLGAAAPLPTAATGAVAVAGGAAAVACLAGVAG